MIFEEILTTSPLSLKDFNRRHAQAVERPLALPAQDLYENDLNSTNQSTAFVIPATRPIPAQAVKKMLAGGLYAFSLADWIFNKDNLATRPIVNERYVLRALQYVPSGISVSRDLITSRESLKASILMPPSGLYLAWLKASEEDDGIAL